MDERDFKGLSARRRFLTEVAGGVGMMALADLLRAGTLPEVNPLAPKKPHFPGKAKNVIFLFMEGGPSQMDLFDPKPELQKISGQTLPESLVKQTRLAFIKKDAKVLASPRIFQPQGKSGVEYSDYIPHTGAARTTFAWCGRCSRMRSIIIPGSCC